MTRHGLTGAPLAMPQRETEPFVPAVILTGASRSEPGPSRPASMQMRLISCPRAAGRPRRMERNPFAKLHPNPKSP